MKRILLSNFSSILVFLLLLFLGNKFGKKLMAQDIHFSQFYMAPLAQNPALAGALYDTEALLNYKNQWKTIGSPYSTMAASYDMKLNRKKYQKGLLSAGINFFNDKAGDGSLNTTQANITVAYHVKVAKYIAIGAGVQGGVAQRNINYDALSWGNQYDGTSINTALSSGESSIGANKIAPDFSGGVLWMYNNTDGERKVTDNHDVKANIGFSVFHLNRPNIGLNGNNDNLHSRYVLHGGGIYSFENTNLAIVPGFMYYRQGTVQEIYAGTMVRFKLSQESKYTFFQKGSAISLGGYYRAKDAMALTMLFEYSHYAMGISYDINTSQLKTVTGYRGGFEITLRYVTPNPFIPNLQTTRL